MKKTILCLLTAVMLASVPVTDLFARASHGDWYFREEVGGTHYSAYSLGNGKVHYKILVFASGKSRNFWAYQEEEYGVEACSRCWTHLEGAADNDYPNFMIYEADNNGHNRPKGDGGSNPNDRGWVRLKVLSGAIIVTNTYDGEPDYVSADGEWHEFWLKRQATEDWLTYLEFDWIEPTDYAGKVYWVGNSVRYRREGGDPSDQARGEQTRTLAKLTGGNPDAAPQLQNPFLYVLNENGTAGYGKIAVPYFSTQQPYNYWINGKGDPIKCDERGGLIFVNSDDVIRSLYITMETQRSTDSMQTQILSSNSVNIPAYHKINRFAADAVNSQDAATGKWYRDYRKKKLTWIIKNPNEQELMENDMFEIQRAYHADYSDAETIGLIPMEYDPLATDTVTKEQTYTFIDTTNAAWWNPIENSYKIYYQVRRVSSAQWGWTDHKFAARVTADPSQVNSGAYKPMPYFSGNYAGEYTLDPEFEENRKVHITVRLKANSSPKIETRTEDDPAIERLYWDPNQRLMILKVLKETNDTIRYTIPNDTIYAAIRRLKAQDDATYKAGKLEITYTDYANTPCVHYEYYAFIDTSNTTVRQFFETKPYGLLDLEGEVIYYTEAANINSFNASKLEYSDGVLLTWDLTEGNIGSYKIETRPAGKDTAWTVLEEDYGGSWYKDKTANPFVSREWEYRLTMTYECNGNVKTASKTTTGSRNPYGKVSGYVRYEDGSACPGIEVKASRTSTGETVQKVTTDEDGYYLLDSLIYGEGRAYAIQPESMSAEFRFNNSDAPSATITLGLNGCIRENVNFANISSVPFSGRVLYENSTVPVRDVHFMLNGIPVKSGTSLYKTDASGNFEFRVPKRTPFTIQAYKEGHTFAGDGFVRMINDLTQEEDSVLSLEGRLAGVRIYDQTKVRLIGRLAGGRVQAEKPLGFGLSRNNLGDDLKLVFELEGDNISQIVHFKDDLARDSVTINLRHDVRTAGGTDSTGVTRTEYYKKRIIIYPDVNTGEYYVDLFPVKYKITQATARGYATLYADGKTSESLDLTNAPLHQRTNTYEGKELDYNETYNITYHSPISISCTQLQFGMPVDYYGEKTMKRQNIQNQKIEVPLVEKQTNGTYKYLFGAPVFEMGKYQFIVKAYEDYYYNNDPFSTQHEEVRLHGGTLKVYNGMHDAVNTEVQSHELDTLGQAMIVIPIDYVSFIKTGENALRVLDLSVEYQGAYVESQVLRAYVAGNKAKGQDFTASTHGDVILLDILRDPPGSGSSAYIEAGTSYSYDYKYDIDFKFGVDISIGYGTDLNYVVGSWAGVGGGVFVGSPINVSNTIKTSIPVVGEYYYKHGGSYTFSTTERITTASDPLSVGAPADVFIGATQNILYGLTDAVKPIDSLTYVTLAARAANGTIRVVAEGRNLQGEKYYLVIGTEMGSETYINSTFVHTQSYIENNLLPQLRQQRDALLMTGDSATVAAIATATGKPAYWSKVDPEEENFGIEGYYVQILPDSEKIYDDEVAAYNRQLVNWTGLLIRNEEEKIAALKGSKGKLVGTWSMGGATSVTHTENYAYSNVYSNQLLYPGVSGSIPGPDLTKLANLIPSNLLNKVNSKYADAQEGDPFDFICKAQGGTWKFSLTPILNFSYNRNPESSGTGHTKSTGFTLRGDDLSYEYLNVSVYRIEDEANSFNAASDGTRGYVSADDYIYGSYVYYLNGGATRCPWEGPDSTRFFTPKVPLSAGTLKLENPKLDIDVHERSNVPVDQPAVFNLRITNEGEVPYGSGNSGIKFTLKLQEGSNPKGAKIMIDGAPLLEAGREIRLTRGAIELKHVEVYAGEGYDFENIVLTLMSNCSMSELAKCTFSVHFMPVACPVNISAPHSNWIMNTLSPQDSTGWYLPVVIDGFDVNYKNFDHIEFQYKLATHSDDDWVNLCSYFADDSLYTAASGNKAMITSGRIENIRFYGERDPMEQQYDLRAVAFCRHGNGFITRASEVMRGVKDTRIPRVFGEAEPANSILGVGDNILLRFNEPIAGNYLDEDNNFQLVGYTNETGITTGISLHFIDTENSYAESKVVRSLSDKSFTVDMMVRPEDPNAAYTFFNYNTKGGRTFSFGKTADNRLVARFGNGAIYSDTLPEKMIAFTRVAVVYDRENHLVRFYAGTKEVTDTLIAPFDSDIEFSGSSPVSIGKGFAGNMMEVRLWTKALAPDEIAQTNMRRLTGYERELVAYYPMNEGSGNTIADKANGATLYARQTTWEYQKGISLRVTDGQTVKLDDALLSRSDKQDETLMFWFKSPRKRGTIFSAGRMSNTEGTELSFSNGALVLKNYRNEWKIDGNYADNEWHHFAMTINRTFNNVAVYVDDKQKLSFAATKMGEVSGEMYIGGDEFDGNIDEFIIFEQALPQSLMETYGTISPMGDEMGLLAYLPFAEMKENENGILEQVFSVNDQRVFKTSEGDVVEKVQPLILSVSDSTALKDLGDRTLSAPVQDIGQLTKMNFDWSFNNDELLINLNMRDREINKQTIYITVRDVEDLNGNPMASPVTWMTFIDRNSLKWEKREIAAYAVYGKNVDGITRTMRVINQSGKRHTFSIESLPEWLSVDQEFGTIEPADEIVITFKMNTDIAVGVYTDVIYLTDEQGLSEPLRVELTIDAKPPYDAPDETLFPYNMSICAQVMIDGIYDTDPNDIVYAFSRNECVGKENITFNESVNSSKVFLTIYGNEQMNKLPIRFQVWQASTGKVYDLAANRNIIFSHGFVYGCGETEPLVLATTGSETQAITLKNGWNWISVNLDLTQSEGEINTCMTANEPWNDGDLIKNPESRQFTSYDGVSNTFIGSLGKLHHTQIYMVNCSEGNTLRIAGDILHEDSMEIRVRGDGQWSVLPCLYDQVTSLTDALASYYDYATPGDLIKARNRFATFSDDKKWEGNLSALRPGEGYLFRRLGAGAVAIPFYKQTNNAPHRNQSSVSDSDLSGEAGLSSVSDSGVPTNNMQWGAHSGLYSNPNAATNMTMIATLASVSEAVCLPSAKRSVYVFVGDELAGVAEPIDSLYFITIQSDRTGAPLTFRTADGLLLRSVDISTSQYLDISYSADTHYGTLKSPILLSPTENGAGDVYKIIENDHIVIIRDGERYDITGVKLNK